jgi:RHS repeat-associated protein
VTPRLPFRLRTVALAALLAASGFAVEATPTEVELPVARPEALSPAPAKALACADHPSFMGRLTGSKTSTTAITRSTTGNVYGYISDVVDDWSCTAYYRYDGLVWSRNDGELDGNFDWGNLINSTSVPCNWTIGSTNYLKSNSTNDCADSDAEYAMPIYLANTSAGGLLEGICSNDITPNEPCDFGFIHSDCTSYYGGEVIQWNEPFSTSVVGTRPGSNCDPYVHESTNTSQSIIVDGTPPSLAVTAPAGAAGTIVGTTASSYGLTINPSDNVANFGATHPWTVQRQIATNTGGGTCATFGNDPAPGALLSGTIEGSQAHNQALVTGACYRWVMTGSDMNGNTAVALTSATLIRDLTAPALSFVNPPVGSTIGRNTTAFSVAWTETEAHSGIATRSLQRQRLSATSPACPGTFTNDGSPVTTASPSAQTLASGFCYQWVQTLTDRAGNTVNLTSGRVYVDTTMPMADFTTPDEATLTNQTSTAYSVAWTETAGSGTITARSLRRLRAAFGSGSCPATPFADDPTEGDLTSTSPVAATLTGGYCYQWTQTLTNSGGKSGTTTSGVVVVDTSPPTGTISFPETNRALAGTITISGTAADAGSFKDYGLEYGAGATPSSWTSLGTWTTPVTATGPLAGWATGTLSGVYTLRLTVREYASATSSVTTRTVYLENARRGTESYVTRVPFELGGELALDVGVANGEARLARDLFSIPSYGPPQALSLTYSSAEPGAAGRFGVGWSSDLTQYLSFDIAGGVTVWHRADGGRVPFGLLGSTWTPLAGHYETMSVAGGEVTITTREQTRYVFEDAGAGRLKRIEDRFGQALTLAWNTGSATATDASGRATTLTIDAANARISAASDSAGRAWAFGYTGTGANSDLTTITDPAGKVTTLAYTGHALTGVSRSRSRVSGGPETVTWTIGYSAGRATSVDDPVSSVASTFTYGANATDVDLVVEDATATKARTTYAFDDSGLGRVALETDPLGATTSRTFDANSNVTSESRPTEDDGTAVTSYTYDTAGNVLSRTDPLDASTSVETVFTYNATNDVLTETEANDKDATRTVTRSTYDGSGQLTSVNRNCTSSGTTVPAEDQGATCTGAGTQDAATNVITEYAWTANHQLAAERDPLGYVTKHVYDAWGNETATIEHCTTSGTTPPSPWASCTGGGTHDAQTNVTSGSTFDQGTIAGAAGLPTRTTDPLGRDTTFTYDALGRQLTEVLPGDSSVPALTRTTTWDELGNTLTETESWTPAGGSLQTRTTSHVYDLVNRETSVTDPAGVVSTTSFDDAGNELATSAGGVVTLREYDLAGQPVEERLADPGEPATVRSYTTLGAVRTTITPIGVRKVDVTDLAGRRTQARTEADPLLGLPALVATSEFDTLGRQTSETDEAGHETVNTYDRLGRLLTSSLEGATTSYSYDRAGNQLSETDPEGVVTTTAYDPLGRAISVVVNDVASPNEPDEDVTTTTWYDAAGNTVAVRDPGGITARTIVNVRDGTARTIANCTDSGTTPTSDPPACTGAGTHSDTANVITDLAYDGQGTVVRTVSAVGRPAEATTETAYDAAGRVQATRDALGTITRHKYNAAGQLTDTYQNCTTTGTTIPTDWAACTGGGTADATWNLRTITAYDAHGNQASVTAPNGRLTTSVYDDDDRLVRTIDNDVASPTLPIHDVTTDYFFDAYGRGAAVRTPSATSSPGVVTRTVFNDDGTVAAEIRNCTDSGTTPPADPAACTGAGTKNAETNVSITYAYDERGNRIRLTAPDPAATSGTSTATVTTQYAYDEADRLCRVVENATGATDLQALADPCASATQTAGTTTANVSTRYAYDDAGNLITMIDATGATTSYEYDADGRMTGLVDPLGEKLVWAYDDAGNRVRQENRADPPLTASVTWTHDAAGRLLTRTADGVTVTYGYDAAGNRLTATDGTLTITAAYDRIGRPLTVDDEDAGTTADTTYGYAHVFPSRTDPSGFYAFDLDKFGRVTAYDDPVEAGDFALTFRADGQPATVAAPNGNTTTHAYDALGHLTSKDTAAGGTNRALYDWTRNRAGQMLSEASTITGDPANGTLTYGYDPLGRLVGSTLSGTTTAYGWDADVNRTSVQVGGGPAATTAYDAADRPTGGANPTASYGSDDDGRLTVRPGQQLLWDHLGRLTGVKDGVGVTLAAYSYDPLDRLRLIDYGAGVRVRFRYVGLTTAVVQWIDDASGTVTRSVGTGWDGERLLDWTGAGSNIRLYGTNAHHDTTWLASTAGAVTQALRYDPWGTPRSTVPSGYTPFRFQGAWTDVLNDTDPANDLAWVVTRWYAPALGRFISEDSLLGEPITPPSRHLYAYGAGEPVGRWDPDGRFWYKWRATDDITAVAKRWLGSESRWRAIFNMNLNRSQSQKYPNGACIWVPRGVWFGDAEDQCSTSYKYKTAVPGEETKKAARVVLGSVRAWYTISPSTIASKTQRMVHRVRSPSGSKAFAYNYNRAYGAAMARTLSLQFLGLSVRKGPGRMKVVCCSNTLPPSGNTAATYGEYVFVEDSKAFLADTPRKRALLAHEYIHVLQWEAGGLAFGVEYLARLPFGTDASNPLEAPGYLWEGYVTAFDKYRNSGLRRLPWKIWKPL